MNSEDYVQHDGLGLAALVKSGDVSPLELCESAMELAEKHNDTLNAIVHKAYDDAKKTAQSDLPEGPFKGVPFLIKDLGCAVKDWPRTSGSRFVADEVPDFDSELTKRFRAAGVVLMGKTNTPEFGITGTTESALLGPCRNPWNPNHISGGSSGGAASSVAAGIVPLAHASDGLGSIRIPAACCGLFGLKVTRERNPATPNDFTRAIGLSVDHVVSRTVRDSAAMLDATGYPEIDAPFAPAPKDRPYMEEIEKSAGKLKIAYWSKRPNGKEIDPEIQSAFDKSIDLVHHLGHEVVELNLPIDTRAFYRAQGIVSGANFAADVKRMIARKGREPQEDEFEALTWAGYKRGLSFTAQDALEAWQELRIMSRQIIGFFQDFDVFMSPVLGTPVPEVGFVDPVNLEPREVSRRQAKVFPFTPPFNVSGQPAMSVPLYEDQAGLPIGIQFAGRYGDEATLFRLAAQLEKEIPWIQRKPQVWG